MTVPQPVDGLDPRRAYARLELGLEAHFDTLDGRQSVRLVDLSQAGAHLVLSDPAPVSEGVLSWLRFDTFGVVVWQNEEHIGLQFDRLVPLPQLIETRHRAPSIVLEMAQDWVAGA
jgi:hypothetical protein